jgi:cell division protein FtsQ
MAKTTQTQRQKQSLEASRKRARRKRSHWLSLRLKIAGGVLAAALAVTLGVLWFNGTLAKAQAHTIAKIDAATIRLGFSIETIYLEGRSRTTAEAVENTLNLKKGDPLLTLSLGAVRERLESIPTVKTAVVERALPSTLHVKLIEREPVAIWQYKQKLALIDDAGAVMPDLEVEQYANLPLLIGEGVPEHVKEALELRQSTPEFAEQIAHITRIGNRRWDVALKRGVTVRLPAENHLAAWTKLMQMNKETQIAARSIKVIDMRDPMKLILQRSLVPTTGKTSPAQET